jgi:hypothetical protein
VWALPGEEVRVSHDLELERSHEPADDTAGRVARAISILLEDREGARDGEATA